MHRLLRATVHPGVAVLVADDPVQLHAYGASAALLEDAGTLPFGFQHPQAAGEDMVNFRSQCHGSTCNKYRVSATLLISGKARKVINKYVNNHF
ncbi:hypothetical protein D3C81_2072120 [compost metagenome]